MEFMQINSLFATKICQSLFSFGIVGAKEKSYQKRKTPRLISRVATRDKGFAPLTAPPFEKGGQKLSHTGARKLLAFRLSF